MSLHSRLRTVVSLVLLIVLLIIHIALYLVVFNVPTFPPRYKMLIDRHMMEQHVLVQVPGTGTGFGDASLSFYALPEIPSRVGILLLTPSNSGIVNCTSARCLAAFTSDCGEVGANTYRAKEHRRRPR